MSQQIQEQLSALMDGELQRDETLFLMRRIDGDRDLVERWSSYHVCRQSLRRQEILPLRGDFAASVMAQIELEAAPASSRMAPWLRWASGGAIAASVAVAALVISAPPSAPGMPGDAIVAASTPAPASVAPPTLNSSSDFPPPVVSSPWAVQPASASTSGFSSPGTPIDPRLQSYLIRHYDASAGAGQAGMMPYVLLIVPTQQQAANAASLSDGTTDQR